MKRENCINRNITIASAIISGVNILTFYNVLKLPTPKRCAEP